MTDASPVFANQPHLRYACAVTTCVAYAVPGGSYCPIHQSQPAPATVTPAAPTGRRRRRRQSARQVQS